MIQWYCYFWLFLAVLLYTKCRRMTYYCSCIWLPYSKLIPAQMSIETETTDRSIEIFSWDESRRDNIQLNSSESTFLPFLVQTVTWIVIWRCCCILILRQAFKALRLWWEHAGDSVPEADPLFLLPLNIQTLHAWDRRSTDSRKSRNALQLSLHILSNACKLQSLAMVLSLTIPISRTFSDKALQIFTDH